MRIQLDNRYCILSDDKQWILGKEIKSGRIIYVGFYGKLSSLLQNYASICLRLSDAQTIKELLESQKELETRLCKLLQSLETRIQSKFGE